MRDYKDYTTTPRRWTAPIAFWLLCFGIGAFWTYVLLCVGGHH
jgi:hypothetical protein